MKDEYFDKLMKLAKKAYKKGEIPVSAIIVKGNKIIASAYNKRVKTNNPLMHAEVQCIIKAGKKNKDWRLDDYDLYVTMEPCHMCKEIINECRIKNTYYLIKNDKIVNYKQTINKISSDKCNEYIDLLKEFFKNIRK